MGLASSLESMTLTVRDAMIESWGITDELDEDAEAEEDLTAAVGDDDEDDDGRPVESDTDQTETDHQDHSVQSDDDEGCLQLPFLLSKLVLHNGGLTRA